MKMNLGEIVAGQSALIKLGSAELPIKLAYRISKLITIVDNELKIFEEKRQSLVKKYGTTKGEEVVVDAKKVSLFQNELNELLSVEVKLEFDPILIDDIASIKMTPIDLSLLRKIIIS